MSDVIKRQKQSIGFIMPDTKSICMKHIGTEYEATTYLLRAFIKSEDNCALRGINFTDKIN